MNRIAKRFFANQVGEKLKVTFTCPHQVILKDSLLNQVNMMASTGSVGILAHHVPTLFQLKPGVLELVSDNQSSQYFVSGGFAAVNSDNTLDINAIEAFKLDDFDASKAEKLRADAEIKVKNSKNDIEVGEGEIELEVAQAILTAIKK
ncbi:hypothetical protein ROZALSC1DRAFT_28431 [Rozella allomycis CSF55]|uniref:ATP synthase subunit delta, mitochondrial n=1 Tax=Rozella allomycis (strain CSF55) TaxID=988480 RepID=A0A075B1V9_ROZAC|nr:ATPase, F1 complex, delta/epsilon subunit domain-containing protein [Rozella allomycis CSF55]RKP20042.1 hypothetical protein ROZALSC1DRAFT_28431 [Rozella allomycis CSF55]|eukprot:EPZ34783.1 ATPase, F1 complex, delta/epsilon subunit domain-containing protein [Rozella allomycis CSF55]